MVKNIFSIIVLFALAASASAQEKDTFKTPDYISTDDSTLFTKIIKLRPVTVVDLQLTAEDRAKYRATKYRVNKVYPYAMQALQMMQETDNELSAIKKKRKKKKYLKNEQKELKQEYADFLKDFTVEEGRIMIKIIERSTDMTFYELIKKYRNTLTATYWNALANTQGYSLKDGYDPKEERILEMVLSTMDE